VHRVGRGQDLEGQRRIRQHDHDAIAATDAEGLEPRRGIFHGSPSSNTRIDGVAA
jgi:hypothetical protein